VHSASAGHKEASKRAATATVTLRGSVNGRSFVVSRSVSATKTDSHALRLWVDGVDVSKQSVKETQEELEQLLPVPVLADAVFHGQHLVRSVCLPLCVYVCVSVCLHVCTVCTYAPTRPETLRMMLYRSSATRLASR
jgi:hypothetical protein